jgi:hypothetical protein
MNERILAAGLILITVSLAACSDDTATVTAVDDDHPRTPWGDPDLQGTWPIMHLISTPFQRPEEYGTRELLTDEEYAETQGRLEARNERYENEIQNNKMGMGHWAESSHNIDAARMTSLLVYPEDGRFPALTERGEELSNQIASSWSTEQGGEGFDSVADFDTWDRCITRGMPVSMFPFNYNNGIRIHQSPGYVVIELEMIHEARIVPVNGQPPLPSEIQQWMGESRGHWEGNKLVVETTNFNGRGGQTNIGIPGSPRHDTPMTTNMKITETFERVSENQMNYHIKVEDPEVLATHWEARYPMILDNTYQFFEYACHEDNTAVRNFIETSRYERAHPAQQEGDGP